MKKVLCLILALVMMLSMVACGAKEEVTEDAGDDAAAAAGDPIVIGTYQPLTGVNALQGQGALNSIQMYVDDLNANGGMLGRPVELVYYDDASTPEQAVKAVTKMLESDGIDLCIGSIISGCVLATGELLEAAEIPTMGMGLSPTFMQQGWTYMIRPALNTGFSIPTYTSTMKEMGFDTIAVFEGQDDYGVQAGKNMRAACDEAGIKVTTTENYVTGDTDFSGQIAKILGTNPDCVFCGCFGGDIGNVIKQFRQYGYDGILFYSEAPTGDVINVTGEAIDHVVFKYPFVVYDDINDCTDPFMKAFLEEYNAKYGYLPKGEATYRGWDGMIVLDAAIKAAGTVEGPAVKEAMYKLSGIQGLGGTFDFTDGTGEGLHDFAAWIMIDQKPMELGAWKSTDDYKAMADKFGW